MPADATDQPNLTSRAPDIAILILLLGLGAAIYSPVLNIRPLSGDNLYILGWADQAPVGSLFRLDPKIYPEWRPLAFQTVWFEHRLLPLDAVAVHFVINGSLSVACGVLVYLLVLELTGSRLASFLAAVRLLVDDRSIQSVTWIIERQTTMACACGLLAVLLILRAGSRPLTRRRLIAVALLLLASALGKEYGLAFTVAVIGYAAWQRNTGLGWAGLAAGLTYTLMRIGFADGAWHRYCEDMGYFYSFQEQCIDPFSASGVVQMGYNAIASGIGIVLPGLLDNFGLISLSPRRLVVSAVLLGVASAGVARGGAHLRLIALVAAANALLSFMIYRERNQLIGAAAMAVAVGVGLARWQRTSVRPAFNQLGRAACAGALLMLLGRQALITHRMVSAEVVELLEEDPCDSPIRNRSFGGRFVEKVKFAYRMSDPTCKAAN